MRPFRTETTPTGTPAACPGEPDALAGPPRLVPQKWHDAANILTEVFSFTLLIGEPGVGKSAFAHSVGWRRDGRPPIVIDGKAGRDEFDLWGRQGLSREGTTYEEGPLARAIRAGRTLVIDEYSKIALEERDVFLPLRDRARRVTNPHTFETIDVHPAFRAILTSNVESLQCRRNADFARAQLDGMGVLFVPPLERNQIAGILAADFPTAPKGLVDFAVEKWEAFKDIRAGSADDSRPRAGYRSAQALMRLLLDKRLSREEAVRVTLVNQYAASREALEAASLKLGISTK